MPLLEAQFYFDKIRKEFPIFSTELPAPLKISMKFADKKTSNPANPANLIQRETYSNYYKQLKELKSKGIPDVTSQMYYDAILRDFQFVQDLPNPNSIAVNPVEKVKLYADYYNELSNYVKNVEAEIVESKPQTILNLDSLPTAADIESKALARITENKNVPEGFVRVMFDVKIEYYVGAKDKKTAAYNTKCNDVKSTYFTSILPDVDKIEAKKVCRYIKDNEIVNGIKLSKAFLRFDKSTVKINEIITLAQYQKLIKGSDIARSFSENIEKLDLNRRNTYSGILYPIRYISSSNLVSFFPEENKIRFGEEENFPFEDRLLYGALDDKLLIKHDGLQYGNQNMECMPALIDKNFNVGAKQFKMNWSLPTTKLNQGFTMKDLHRFAVENNLSYYLVNECNDLLSHNVGTKEVMNHKKCLVGMIIGNHINEVTDQNLRKSIIEHAKHDEVETLDTYYEEEEETLEKAIEKAEEKVDRELDVDEKSSVEIAFKVMKEAAEKLREQELEMFKNKITIDNIYSLADRIKTVSHEPKMILYSGDFNDVLGCVIRNNIQENNVLTIPNKRDLKFRQGKLYEIRFNNYHIRNDVDEDSVNFYNLCASVKTALKEINAKGIPEILKCFGGIAPMKSINANAKDLVDFLLKGSSSQLNPIVSKFMNATCTQDYCRPLDEIPYAIEEIYHGDLSKAYQVAGTNLEYGDYTLFDGLELFYPYKIEDNIIRNAFYYVKCESEHIFFQGNGVYEGNKIISWLENGVITHADIKQYAIGAKSYDRARFENFIITVNKLFGPDDAKTVIVNAIGNLKPNTTKRFKHNAIIMDLQVLYNKIVKYGKAFHYETFEVEGHTLFNICKANEFEIYKTGRPLHMAIKDRTGCEMIKLYNVIKAAGARPFYIKTDNIFYAFGSDKVVDYINKNYKTTHIKLPKFGTIKHEKTLCQPANFTKRTPNFNIAQLPDIIKPINVIVSEDNGIEFAKTLIKLDGYMTNAPGGYGKTYLYHSQEEAIGMGMTYVDEFVIPNLIWEEHKIMKMAYTNTAVMLTNGKTFHRTFKLSKGRNVFFKIQPTLKKLAESYHYIMIDECSMITKTVYECLIYIKSINPSIKIMLFGDWRQTAPVEPELKINYDYQHHKLVNYLTGFNIVKLTKNYRSGAFAKWSDLIKQENLNVFYRQIGRTFIPSDELVASGIKIVKEDAPINVQINIANTNSKCMAVNNSCMSKMVSYLKKTGGETIFVPVPKNLTKLKNRTAIWLYSGLRLIGKANVYNYAQKASKKAPELIDELNTFGNKALHTNEHYIVTDISENTFCVKSNPLFSNDYKEAVYKIDDLHKLFVLGYCFTAHSAQGITIKSKYNIHEFSKMCYRDIKILYTALSRCQDPADITLYTCTYEENLTEIVDEEPEQTEVYSSIDWNSVPLLAFVETKPVIEKEFADMSYEEMLNYVNTQYSAAELDAQERADDLRNYDYVAPIKNISKIEEGHQEKEYNDVDLAILHEFDNDYNIDAFSEIKFGW